MRHLKFVPYWTAVFSQIPKLFYSSARDLRAAIIFVLFILSTALNRQVVSYLQTTWTGFSPAWALAPLCFMVIYGLMRLVHNDHEMLHRRIAALEEKLFYQASKPFPKNLGTKQLKEAAFGLVTPLQDMSLRERSKLRELLDSRSSETIRKYPNPNTPLPPEELAWRGQEWVESGRKYEELRREHLDAYLKHYQTNAILFRDELLARLPPDALKYTAGEFSPKYKATDAGFMIEDVAGNLEFLARQIPDSNE